MNLSNHDKIQLVHDAMAEGKGSDALYLAIHEHYQDARFHGPCSEGYDISARLIGSLIINAIRDAERAEEREQMQGEEEENAAACAADDRYHERLERGEV